MKNIHEWVNTGLIAIVAVLLMVGGNSQPNFGSPDGNFRMPNSNAQFKTVTSAGAFSATTIAGTATTTLSDGLNLNNAGICINFYATSSATRLHMVASTTDTLPGGAAAVMTAEYGACAY